MKNAGNEILMTKGSIAKQLFWFSLPLLVGNLCQQLYQIVDLLVIGNFIRDGGIALAAVGSGTSFIFMMISFFVGISTGAGVVVSRCFGAQDSDGTEKSIRVSLLIAVIAGSLLSVISIATCDLLLRLTNTPDDVLAEASLYLKIYYSGFLPLLVYNMGAAILQALGNSKTPFYFLLVSCGINILLDVLFVGSFGWGVAGVGVATVIAQIISCILVLRKMNQLAPLRKKTEYGKGERRSIGKRILYYGIPLSIQSITISLSNIIIQSFINALGTTVIAAWGIFNKLDGFLLLPIVSFGIALTTFTSQNVGAGRMDRVRKGMGTGMLLTCGTTIVFSAVFFLCAGKMGRLFTEESEVIMQTAGIVRYMVPFYILIAMIRAYAGVLSGAGHTLGSSVIMVVNMCGLRVLILFLASDHFGRSLSIIYYTYWASWALCVLCCAVYYYCVIIRRPPEIWEGLPHA